MPDNSDNFLFTDRKNGCVYEICEQQYRKWNKDCPNHASQLNNPTGIAINKTNEVFVADYGGHRIYKFDLTGNLLESFGERVLQSPTFLAFNSKDQLYVSDGESGIKVFDRTDTTTNYEWSQTIQIKTDDRRWQCRGIAIDKNDNIFVTIHAVSFPPFLSYEKVAVYDHTHKPLVNFGGFMQFNGIRGICFHYESNYVVIVEGDGGRLQRYKLYKHETTSPVPDISSLSTAIHDDHRARRRRKDDRSTHDAEKTEVEEEVIDVGENIEVVTDLSLSQDLRGLSDHKEDFSQIPKRVQTGGDSEQIEAYYHIVPTLKEALP